MLEWKVSNLKNLFEQSKGEAKSKCVKVQLSRSCSLVASLSLTLSRCALGCPTVCFIRQPPLANLPVPRPSFPASLSYSLLPAPSADPHLEQNSGHEQYCSLYLSCEPTSAEKERGLAERAGWAAGREGQAAVGAGPGGGAPEAVGIVGGTAGAAGGRMVGKDVKGPWKREGKFKFTFEVSFGWGEVFGEEWRSPREVTRRSRADLSLFTQPYYLLSNRAAPLR